MGKHALRRSLITVALGCGLLLCAVPTVSLAKDKVLRPTDRVRSIKASKVRPGSEIFTNRLPYLRVGRSSAARAGVSPSGPAGVAAASGPPPTPLLNRTGIRDEDLSPSDSTGAIGPAHYVEIVNSKIAVYNRADLTLISSADADAEFSQVSFFDPQIQWDPQAQRWLYVAVGPIINGNWTLAYGWTKTSDPTDVDSTDGTSGWCHYVLQTTTQSDRRLLDDYPKLGHSDDYLLIGTNMFTGFGGAPTFAGSRVWAINKPAAGTTCQSGQIAASFGAEGSTAADPGWAPSLDAGAGEHDRHGAQRLRRGRRQPQRGQPGRTASQIMAWHVRKAPLGPELVQDGNIDVPPFRPGPNVPQQGNQSVLANQGEGRLTNAVMQADPDAGGAKAVWTQHAVEGPGGRSDVRWYELLPATRAVRQNGSIGSEHHSFNAAISPTKAGNGAAIFYNVSSSTQITQIRGRARVSGTPLGQLGDEVVLGTSSGVPTCDFPCRWGDYSGASPDPNNPAAVWGTNSLTQAPFEEDWTTRNFAVSVESLSRLATFEDGAVVHPTTGFDSMIGLLEIKGTGSFPGPYEGSKYVRAVYFPTTGSAQGRFNRALVNGSEVWYGAAFYLDSGFTQNSENLALLQWSDPAGPVHGGVSLRDDDLFHVVRGRTASPFDDINVGPSFSLPENRWFWLEVHQRLHRTDPHTEVFLNGRLISTSVSVNNYPDSSGVPSRISYGIGTTEGNAMQVHLDRASMNVGQRGAFGAPATPTGFTGSGQDRTAIIYWTAVAGASGYRVYKQASDGNWAQRFDTQTTGCVRRRSRQLRHVQLPRDGVQQRRAREQCVRSPGDHAARTRPAVLS